MAATNSNVHVGDTVRITGTFPNGETQVRTVIATRVADGYVEGTYLTHKTALTGHEIEGYSLKVEILERATIPEPTTPGAVVKFDRYLSWRDHPVPIVLMRTPTGKWETVSPSLGNVWGWDNVLKDALPGTLEMASEGYRPDSETV